MDAIREMLRDLLGRSPTEEEVDTVLAKREDLTEEEWIAVLTRQATFICDLIGSQPIRIDRFISDGNDVIFPES